MQRTPVWAKDARKLIKRTYGKGWVVRPQRSGRVQILREWNDGTTSSCTVDLDWSPKAIPQLLALIERLARMTSPTAEGGQGLPLAKAAAMVRVEDAGGSVEAIDLDPVYADTAVRAAQIMGLRVAGVDMLEGADGPVVMEVNSSPGFEGIERATGLDIAGAIIDYVAAQVAFPEIDVRQRLSVSAGYGVVELSINEGAALVAAGTTIGGLREQDISVLTLNRGTTVIPNPRSDRIIEVDDRLLCFGNLEAMRGLVPERRRSRLRVQPLPDEPLLEEQR